MNPLSFPSLAGVQSPLSEVKFGSREKPRILMVEDDYQAEVNQVLKGFNHEMVDMVDTFEAGKEAVAKHQPEIILMDQFIRSKKDGYDLAKDLVANGFPKERILFISNSWVGSFPGFSHIQKISFFNNPKSLLEAIQEIANRHLPSETPPAAPPVSE